MNNSISPNLRLVFDVLRDEVRGDVASARAKMHDDFTVTYMYKDQRGNIFPSFSNISNDDLTEVYEIKGRIYEIKNYAENHFDTHDVVFVEFIERYDDPETGQKYQTPIVIVLEIEGGKIKTNRHYCDNDISFEEISSDKFKSAYRGDGESFTIQ